MSISIPQDAKNIVLCKGTIRDKPQEKRWGLRFVLKLSDCNISDMPQNGVVSVNANYRFIRDDFDEGDEIQVKLKFKNLSDLRHPSYRNYLLSRGINAMATAKSELQLIHKGEDHLHIIEKGRERVWNCLHESIAQPQAGVLKALATGRRDNIGDDIREQFSRAGLAHLLAISGLHVGYVALIIYFLIRMTIGRLPWLIARFPLSRISAALTLPIMWLYVLFTGCAMSTIRAGTMLSIYVMAIILGLRQDLLTTIAAAVIAIIVVSPLSVMDISFQLSVTAVLGIALMAMPLIKRHGFLARGKGTAYRIMGWVFATLIITFAATIFTAPLIAYHFKTFTAVGLIANLVAVPLVGFALQPLIIAASALSIITPSLAFYAWKSAGLFAGALIYIARLASDLGSFLTGELTLSWQEMLFVYAFLAAVISLSRPILRNLKGESIY